MNNRQYPLQSNQIQIGSQLFICPNNSVPSPSPKTRLQILQDLGFTSNEIPNNKIRKQADCNSEAVHQMILEALQYYTKAEVARIFIHDHGMNNLVGLIHYYDQLILHFTKQNILAMVERNYGDINLTTVVKHTPALMQIGFKPEDIFYFVDNNMDPRELDLIFSYVYQSLNKFCKKPGWISTLKQALNNLPKMYNNFPILVQSGFNSDHMLQIGFYHLLLNRLKSPLQNLPEFIGWGFTPDQVTSILANDDGIDNFNAVYKYFPTLAQFGFTPNHVSNMTSFDNAKRYLEIFINHLKFFTNHLEKIGFEEKSLVINNISLLISNCAYTEGQQEFLVKVIEIKRCTDEHQFLQKLSEKQNNIAGPVHHKSKNGRARKRKRISNPSNEEPNSLRITDTQLGTFAMDPNLPLPLLQESESFILPVSPENTALAQTPTIDDFACLSQENLDLRPEDIEEINCNMPRHNVQ